MMTADEVLSTTRAVRRRLDLARPVEPEVIEECLRLATQAPSGGNRQTWRWVVITDPEVRRALAAIYRDGALDAFIAARDAAATDESRTAYDGAAYLATILEQVPVIVIPCQLGEPPLDSNHGAAGWYGSIIPAVWSLMLALRSRGLGTTYTTAHLRREAEVAALLGIPDGVTQVAMLPVAYTLGTEFAPAQRLPVAEIAFRDRWGSTW
jgi:nitroreductase